MDVANNETASRAGNEAAASAGAEIMQNGGTLYGYARVSTQDQRLARQLDALEAFGVQPDHLFSDKASGKDFDRPAWTGLTRKLVPGDVLVVKSIDRLGRNYDEILAQWRYVTHERGAAMRRLMVAVELPSAEETCGTVA